MNNKSLADCYHEMVDETVNKIAEFKKIMTEGLFDLAFQPIVEAISGEVSHFEVLTRLRGQTSFANPFQFIEFGENMGLIPDYDMKVVARVLEILGEYKKIGIEPSICINLSGNSLSSQIFMDNLYALISAEPELCKQLVFEITESARVTSIKNVNEYFHKLRELGIQCSIDDFGTGEATFEYLRHLHVDYVKIDGSYITPEAISTEHGRHLLRALSLLCADMGIDVVAERVENQQAADILVEYGIKYGQGYFYAKPTIDLEILKVTKLAAASSAEITNINQYKN